MYAQALGGLHPWRRPTMPVELLMFCAWAATATLLLGEALASAHPSHNPLWWCTMNGMAGMNAQAPAGGVAKAIASGMPMWGLMTCAMMLPVTLPAVRHVALSASRPQRAVAEFLAAYLGVWLLYGALALALVALIGGRSQPAALIAALGLAAIWQLTRSKRRALGAAERGTPLAPRGWSATAGAISFGVRNGLACVGSCWAIMLVMALIPGERLLWTVALTALICTERLARQPLRTSRGGAALLGAAALLTLVVA
jgi:predicted metal-binding membrane protein